MKKRLLSIILLVAMLFSTVAFTSCYIMHYAGEDTKFTLNSDGQSYTFAYTYLSEECDFVIPGEYNGLPVTKIGYNAFWNREYLKSVTIPASVTFIEDYAFSYCTNLEKVIFEEGSQLKTIEGCAFVDCSSLKEIELPESLEALTGSTFWRCSSLESIHIPKNVNHFSGACFEECSSLKSITVDALNETYTMEGNFIYEMKDGKKHIALCLGGDDDGVLRIPEDVDSFDAWRAFVTCKNVDTVYMHAGLDEIPEVDGAKEYIISEDNSHFCSIDGVVYSKDKTELIYYPRSKEDIEFTVPSFVKSIRGDWLYGAFYYVKYLERVIISEGVTHIGESAFSGSNIRTVELPASLEHIGSQAFYNCHLLEEMKYAGSWWDFMFVDREITWIHYTKNPIIMMTCSSGVRFFWTGIL